MTGGDEMGTVWKKQKTVWRLAGRVVSADTPGADRRTVLSRKWYGTVGGRAKPLCADKQAAERMMRKLEADAGLAAVGLSDPFADHRRTPLADLLKVYAVYLTYKGDTADHVKQTVGRVNALLAGCGFGTTADLDAGKAGEWLAGLRRPAAPVSIPRGETFTPAQVAAILGVSGAGLRATAKRHGVLAAGVGKARRYPRAAVESLAARRGLAAGPQTVNHYVRSVRGFMRWLVKSRKIGSNPLDTLSLLNAGLDVRRGRRELTVEEVRRLLSAARDGGRSYRGLAGPDRMYLYLLAVATGFRANALAHLNPADFDPNDV